MSYSVTHYVWSPEVHRLFPATFHQLVRLLLWVARHLGLPLDLLTCILAMCPYDIASHWPPPRPPTPAAAGARPWSWVAMARQALSFGAAAAPVSGEGGPGLGAARRGSRAFGGGAAVVRGGCPPAAIGERKARKRSHAAANLGGAEQAPAAQRPRRDACHVM